MFLSRLISSQTNHSLMHIREAPSCLSHNLLPISSNLGAKRQSKRQLQQVVMAETKTSAANPEEEDQTDQRKYFKNVLDDIVSLNSLFTVAIFIGLSLATPGQVQSLEARTECNSDTHLRKRLVLLEIASFSCFVFSGFLAKTAKIFLYIYQSKEMKNPHKKMITLVSFYLSIYGTLGGCCCLLLAMVDVVQIKIGKLSCGSVYAIHTVIVLFALITPALCIYFLAVSYGLYTTASGAIQKTKTNKSPNSL